MVECSFKNFHTTEMQLFQPVSEKYISCLSILAKREESMFSQPLQLFHL